MLKSVIIKSGFHSCQIASEVNSIGAIQTGIIPKYMETLLLSEEHSNTQHRFSNDLTNKPLLRIKTKLHVLSKESVQLLCLLNQNFFNFDVQIYMYTLHSLGFRLART